MSDLSKIILSVIISTALAGTVSHFSMKTEIAVIKNDIKHIKERQSQRLKVAKK